MRPCDNARESRKPKLEIRNSKIAVSSEFRVEFPVSLFEFRFSSFGFRVSSFEFRPSTACNAKAHAHILGISEAVRKGVNAYEFYFCFSKVHLIAGSRGRLLWPHPVSLCPRPGGSSRR